MRVAVGEIGPNLFQMMENAGRNPAEVVLERPRDDWVRPPTDAGRPYTHTACLPALPVRRPSLWAEAAEVLPDPLRVGAHVALADSGHRPDVYFAAARVG